MAGWIDTGCWSRGVTVGGVKRVGGGQVGDGGWGVKRACWVQSGTPDQALGMGDDSGALSIHSLTVCSLPCALCMDSSRWGVHCRDAPPGFASDNLEAFIGADEQMLVLGSSWAPFGT